MTVVRLEPAAPRYRVKHSTIEPLRSPDYKGLTILTNWVRFYKSSQRSDAGEARTRRPSVSSQALYHLATAIPGLQRVNNGGLSGLDFINRRCMEWVPIQRHATHLSRKAKHILLNMRLLDIRIRGWAGAMNTGPRRGVAILKLKVRTYGTVRMDVKREYIQIS